MIVNSFEIEGVKLISPEIHKDNRGYFFESYKLSIYNQYLGKEVIFIQDNEAKSSKGVLRGLHFQIPPYEQAKLIRVIQGSILDVAVDLRKNSPTYGKHISVELDDKNKKQLFIPKGFAHGYIVLSKDATIAYKVDNEYRPDMESGIIYNDAKLNIDWKLPSCEILVSDKDINLPPFKENY